MIHPLTFVLSLFALISFAGAVEPKKPPGKLPAFAVEVAKIRKDVEAKLAAISAALEKDSGAAKTEDDRYAIAAKSREESEKISAAAHAQAMKLLLPNAADPPAAAGLAWVGNAKDQDLQSEAVALLRKHHLVRPETIAFAKDNKQSAYAWVEGLLRAQSAAVDLPKDQAWRVRLALATCLQTQAALPALINDNPGQMEAVYGQMRTAELRKADVPELEAEALKIFADVGKKYRAQEFAPGLTVGEFAKSSIFEIEHLGVGKVAPDIAGEDLDGVKFKLSNYRGKTVMLSFWGSWCGPCMGLIPHERELVAEYKGRPFALVGVNSDPEKKELRGVLDKNKITWRSFWCGAKGPDGPIPMTWNVTSWPTVYVIDAQGVIRSKNAYWTARDARIEECVKRAEAGAKK